ncbi:hypothetical protein SKAU_G00259490 [Synaphobranchus kaupii]|uniref:Uncharacterized protein n=1 Tax=Synaphobranchus kaupii TaxID=118154 RepID=A0A9Q1F4G0_SYNKA|nr:hypothetical protein SKAU_G00259490 [Synaphobranchus kaupii]
MCVLDPGEKTAPRGRIAHCNAPQGGPQVLVRPLCLTIRLGMKTRGKTRRGTQGCTERPPNSGGELGPTTGYEVHTNVTPRTARDGEGKEKTGGRLVGSLAPGAHRAGQDEGTGIPFKGRPPETPPDEGDSSGDTWVTCQARGVNPFEDLGADGIGDKKTGVRVIAGVRLGSLGGLHNALNLPGDRSHHTGGRQNGLRISRTGGRGKNAGQGICFNITGTRAERNREIKACKK